MWTVNEETKASGNWCSHSKSIIFLSKKIAAKGKNKIRSKVKHTILTHVRALWNLHLTFWSVGKNLQSWVWVTSGWSWNWTCWSCVFIVDETNQEPLWDLLWCSLILISRLQVKRSVGVGRSARATRCPTSKTADGGWPSRMPAGPAEWKGANYSASKQKVNSGW